MQIIIGVRHIFYLAWSWLAGCCSGVSVQTGFEDLLNEVPMLELCITSVTRHQSDEHCNIGVRARIHKISLSVASLFSAVQPLLFPTS